jgi:integrase
MVCGMASVKRFDGSPFWYACFSVPTGKLDERGRPVQKRVQRTTGEADKGKALQIALSFERAGTLAGTGQMDEAAARQFLAEIAAITGATIRSNEPVEAFLTRWMAAQQARLAPAAFARYAGILQSFARHLATGKAAPISSIGAAQVAAWRDAELAAGKSPSTVNKGLMVLAQAMDEAARQRLTEGNPARGLNVKGAKRTRQHRHAFTLDQFRALVASLQPQAELADGRRSWMDLGTLNDWRTLVMLAGHTGGRQQELAKLEWSQIDLKRGILTLARSKTDDRHWMPLHPSLAAYLAQTPVRSRKGPVMPHLFNRQRRHISNDFRRLILPRIGIVQTTPEREGKTKGRRLAPYSLHSLRHSLSTWLGAAGVDEATRMQLIGHEDKEVNRGYTHTSALQLADALAKVATITTP